MEAGECALPAPPAPRGTGSGCTGWGPAGMGGCALAARLSVLPVIGASLLELKDLNSSMTTPEMAREVEELRKDCASYADKLERIKSATNHVTPEEKEKVKSRQGLSRAPAAEPGPGLGQSYRTLRWVTRSPVQLVPVRRRQGLVWDLGCSAEAVREPRPVSNGDDSRGVFRKQPELPLPCKSLLWAVTCRSVNSSFPVSGDPFHREVHVPAGAL